MKGTTPTFIIDTSVDLTEYEYVAVDIDTGSGLITLDSTQEGGVTVEHDKIKFKLTQAETLTFDARIRIQIRAWDEDEQNAIASNVMYLSVSEVLHDSPVPYTSYGRINYGRANG